MLIVWQTSNMINSRHYVIYAAFRSTLRCTETFFSYFVAKTIYKRFSELLNETCASAIKYTVHKKQRIPRFRRSKKVNTWFVERMIFRVSKECKRYLLVKLKPSYRRVVWRQSGGRKQGLDFEISHQRRNSFKFNNKAK